MHVRSYAQIEPFPTLVEPALAERCTDAAESDAGARARLNIGFADARRHHP
jgi:hypothetical protein